jgi:hypothetical protein
MYSFLDITGNLIKTRSIREFSDRHSLPYNSARSLASGRRARLRGFCSTHPRAKKLRERFTTTLVNLQTGERKILGPSIKKFAKDHDLSLQGLSELVNRRVLAYRGLTLARSVDLADAHTPSKV